LKVRNNTHYLTRDLKKIFSEVLKREGEEELKRRLIVYVEHKKHRAGGVSGCAPYNGNYIRLFLAKNGITSKDVAAIFVHELRHVQGFTHKEMRYWEPQKWAKDYPLRIKEQKPKPKQDIQLVRYERVLKHIKEKERRLKRLKTCLQKWYKKKKYYEKVLTAAGKL